FEKSPATMILLPVVVVLTIEDHSIFGRPRKSPPRSPSENWRGSVVEPCATKRYVLSQMAGDAANVAVLRNLAGMAALSSHGSPTAYVAMAAVSVRCDVVRPPVPPMFRRPPGALVPVPVRNWALSRTFFESANRRASSFS